MTSAGRPYARFRRASRFQVEAAARELGRLGLLDALDYLVLLAAEAPDRYDRAARRWLARLLEESPALTLAAARAPRASGGSRLGGEIVPPSERPYNGRPTTLVFRIRNAPARTSTAPTPIVTAELAFAA